MKPESKKLLEELSRMQHGHALREFLEAEVENLKDLEGITSYDDALGRRNAIRVIKKLFSFMEERKPNQRDPMQYT